MTEDEPKNDEASCLFELTDANGLKVWYNLSELKLSLLLRSYSDSNVHFIDWLIRFI